MEFTQQLNEKHYSKLQEKCREKKGTLLSGKFRNKRTIKIRCEHNHIFLPDLFNVLKGSWCSHPDCLGKRVSEARAAKTKKQQEQRIRKICEEKGGVWVSGEYRNNNTKIHLKCSKNHEFSVVPSSLFAGTWCGRCVGRLPLEERYAEIKYLVEKKGGKLLSRAYSRVRMEYQCKEGHTWFTDPNYIKYGNWCPHCAGNIAHDETQILLEMQKIAADHGGYATKVFKPGPRQAWRAKFICERNHRWDASIYSARKNHWCSTCNTFSTSETICRSLFEWIFQRDFPKTRPDWLVNDRNNRMELDGYNEELNIAFEYQGEQHLEHVPFFHGDDENAFQQRMDDDLKKLDICEQRGLNLFQVPFNIPFEKLQNYLIDEIKLRKLDEKFEINVHKLDVTKIETGNVRKLLDLQKLCRSKGGKCLSKQYIRSNVRLEFECKLGHRWKTSPSSIINNGSWCPECVKTDLSKNFFEKLDMDFIKHTIQAHKGKLLDTFSENRQIRFKVECENGHVWSTDAARLRHGHWCKKCSAKELGKTLKLTIENLRETAIQNDGRCLSEFYFLVGTKYLWECSKKHKWLATAGSIRRGSWCPVCSVPPKPQFEFLGSVEEFLADERRRFLKQDP